MFLRSVVSSNGTALEKYAPTNKLVLDPRVTYLVDSILQDVLNKGTGGPVRARGFMLPAAGKTGTSRDGWFAGFTNNLLCVIWIGFDDNHDLGLTGGVTAGPIWADFMIRATAMPAYRDVRDFEKPEGVDTAVIDSDTLQLATPNCPVTREEVYVTGSAPTQLCEVHGGHGPIMATGLLPFAYFWRRWRKTVPGWRRSQCATGSTGRARCGRRRSARCCQRAGDREEKRPLAEDFWYLWG